jgi:hypothetical protein
VALLLYCIVQYVVSNVESGILVPSKMRLGPHFVTLKDIVISQCDCAPVLVLVLLLLLVLLYFGPDKALIMRYSFKFWLHLIIVGCYLEVACLVTTDDVGSCIALFCFPQLPACLLQYRSTICSLLLFLLWISLFEPVYYYLVPTLSYHEIYLHCLRRPRCRHSVQFRLCCWTGPPVNIAAPVTRTTAYETPVTIDVSGTDTVSDGNNSGPGPTILSIAKALTGYDISSYVLTVDDSGTDGSVTKNDGSKGNDVDTAGKVDTVTYTPKDGFVGEDTFD